MGPVTEFVGEVTGTLKIGALSDNGENHRGNEALQHKNK
jgi:hypothetical protein